MIDFMHAHPILTVTVMSVAIFIIFLLVLFNGSQTGPQTEDIQRGSGDWLWPPNEGGTR